MAVTISGTNGIAVPLGTAAAPGVVNTTSATTGIYNPTSTTLGLSTNGTNAVTIDASQNVTAVANLTLSGTAARITGDFSNATVASRVAFQTSTANSRTNISALPNGTSTIAGIDLYGSSSDPANTSLFRAANTNAEYQLEGTRTGTGTYLPMTFYTGGSERMRIDTSGNVGIGTSAPSAAAKLTLAGTSTTSALLVYNNTAAANTGLFGSVAALTGSGTSNDLAIGAFGSSNMTFYTAAAERMRIDTSGNVGIGLTAPAYNLHVRNAGGNAYVATQYGSGTIGYMLAASNEVQFKAFNGTNDVMTFATGASERMRIDSSGNLLVGTTTANAQFNVLTNSNVVSGRFQNALTSGTTVDILQTLANQAAGTGFYLARFYSAGTPQFAVRGDGTVYAQNTTIQSLSDERLKENITDAADGLDVILGLKTRRFDWKEGYGNNRKNQLGFIAQEVEAVFPEAVDVWEEGESERTEYKSVGPSALIPVLVKAIQELSAEVEALKAKVGA